jgi:hypothetical protein
MRELQLEYIGRPTHYQVEVDMKQGEQVRVQLPNGRVPILIDFYGVRTYEKKPVTFFGKKIGFLSEKDVVIEGSMIISSFRFNFDEDQTTEHSVTICTNEYHAKGVIRMLLVEPEKQVEE